MADTIREQIIAAIKTKLGEILTTKGYNTNLGQYVERCLKEIDPDYNYIVIWAGGETVEREYGLNICSMDVKLEAIISHGSTNPSTIAEQVLGDLIENITNDKLVLGYDAGATEITAGMTITGGTSGAIGYVESITVTSGTWAGHDAAGNITLRRLRTSFFLNNEALKVGGSNYALANGTGTLYSAITTTTNSLAQDIVYSSGGDNSYPDSSALKTGIVANFIIQYKTLEGNPYAQT